jgi:hypothetical protein
MEAVEKTVVSNVDDNNVVIVTRQELVNRLLQKTGSSFMGLKASYSLDAKMLKRNNPYYGIGLKKIAHTLMLVNFDYAKAVEKRSEGEEQAAGTGSWHYMLPSYTGSYSPLSVHKDDIQSYEPFLLKPNTNRFYLRGEFRKSESTILDKDNQVIDSNTIKPFLKSTGKPGPVDFHVVALMNVIEVTLDGVIFRLV